MSTVPPHHPRAPGLDGLRAGAAALVLLSHGRSLVLRDAGPGLSWPAAAFFGVSGLGHQAVIVFFVLSGLLVTDAMLRLAAAGRWSLGAFAAARLTRLWIVLAPCLVLGALLDRIGLALVGSGVPYGIAPIGHPATAPNLGGGVALGNLVFLQTIAVPVLGSNGALWSLANEFWYYALAALGFAAWRARRRPGRAVALAAAAVAVGTFLPAEIFQLAPVWACGGLVALARVHAPAAVAPWRRPAGWLGAGLLSVVLPASRLHWGVGPVAADLALGGAVAALLLALPEPRGAPPGSIAAWARRLADASYSLYLSHLPVLALVAAVMVGPQRLPLGTRAALTLALALGLATLVAGAVWWICERNTGRVRAWLARRTSSRPEPGLVPQEVLR